MMAKLLCAMSALLTLGGMGSSIGGIAAGEGIAIGIGAVLFFGGLVFALLFVGARRGNGLSY